MSFFIGRHKELTKLDKYFQETFKSNNKFNFGSVVGRRRIGKTSLINHFVKIKKNTQEFLFFSLIGIKAEKENKSVERNKRYLLSQLKDYELEFQQNKNFECLDLIKELTGQIEKTENNWLDFFDLLRIIINLVKSTNNLMVVFFFDELPWFGNQKSSSEFFRNFIYFVNKTCFNQKVFLLVSGSSTSWMLEKIVSNRKELHNRLTFKIDLKPFDLQETFSFLKRNNKGVELKKDEGVKYFSVFNGVPFYLQQIDLRYSFEENLQQIFIENNFKKEYEELFYSLFQIKHDTINHLDLLKILSSKKILSISEILEKTTKEFVNKIKQQNVEIKVRRLLIDLEKNHFVSKINYLGKKKNTDYYAITDNFIFFYNKWFENDKVLNKNFIKNPQQLAIYLGQCFELTVFSNFSLIKSIIMKKGLHTGISDSEFEIYYVPEIKNEDTNGSQIDFVVLNKTAKTILLVECKAYNVPYKITEEYRMNLYTKKENLQKMMKTNQNIFFLFVTINGVKKDDVSNQILFEEVALSEDID